MEELVEGAFSKAQLKHKAIKQLREGGMCTPLTQPHMNFRPLAKGRCKCVEAEREELRHQSARLWGSAR